MEARQDVGVVRQRHDAMTMHPDVHEAWEACTRAWELGLLQSHQLARMTFPLAFFSGIVE